jgi:hypothetical protein
MQFLINRFTLALIHSLHKITSPASAVLAAVPNSSGLQPLTLSLALDLTIQQVYSPPTLIPRRISVE